jgi:hypothetical protein
MSIPTQISIPKPCSEDWNAMASHQRFKHCQSCNKSVYPLEEYDTEEAKELLRRSSSVCVRAAYNKNGQVRLRTGFSSVLLLGGLLACGRADEEWEIQGEMEPYPAIEVSEEALHIHPGEAVQVGVSLKNLETLPTSVLKREDKPNPSTEFEMMGKVLSNPNPSQDQSEETEQMNIQASPDNTQQNSSTHK